MLVNKKQAPKPLFPLKHEFIEALNSYIEVAGALADLVSNVNRPEFIKDDKIRGMIKERLDAFKIVRFGANEM